LHAIESALISMPDDLSESARYLVNAMKLCTGFMASIMNNLLDVRKMEEGKMILKATPISLKELMQSVHKMLMPSVRPGVAFINASITEGPDWAVGDSHRMQQVLTNVVTNA
jgi:signal transduction histidine kinase